MNDLILSKEEAESLRAESLSWPSLSLNQRQICDLELLINGGFSPLKGFLNKADYDSVCESSMLKDGSVWPVPITLDINSKFADSLRPGERVALRDAEGVMLAVLKTGDIWKPDKRKEAALVYGTERIDHPGVNYLLNSSDDIYLGGEIIGIQLPEYYDNKRLRRTPKELREIFLTNGWKKIIAFQTRNPMHRAHFELVNRAAERVDANILIHPAVGATKPGDVDHYTRVRCYEAVMPRFEERSAILSLLPLAMRMAGPRETIFHALIRKNYGATHFIIGRDHASPGRDASGKEFYSEDTSKKYRDTFKDKLGIELVECDELVFNKTSKKFTFVSEVKDTSDIVTVSGVELRAHLENDTAIPDWFTFPEVSKELAKKYRPKSQRGVTFFLTGLPSAGKSTVAKMLNARLLESGERNVTLLDGDEVRKHLSSNLGFSKEDRNLNIRRIAFVAREVSKCGGVVICAPIAPFDAIRKEARGMIEEVAQFFLIYISTPIEECEKRDRKGLYAKARAGLLKDFTGIDHPYEVPEDADLVLDTTRLAPEECCERILSLIKI